MTGEHLHGFEGDEPAPYGQPPVEAGPLQRYWDIARLLDVRTRLLRTDIGRRPPGAVWHTAVPRDPFDRRYMDLRTLRQLGYGIRFVDDMQALPAREQAYPDPLSVYVDGRDGPAIGRVTELVAATGSMPDIDRPPLFRDFLDLMTEEGGIYAWQLQSTPPGTPATVTQYMTPQEEAMVPDLRYRGFMTSRLLYGVRGTLRYGDPDHYDTSEDRQVYDMLAWTGYRPFSAQEIYDLGSVPVAYAVSAYKDSIPPPASRQQHARAD